MSFSHFDAPEEKFAGARGDEIWRKIEGPVKDVCYTEAGREADVEDKDVDVVGGAEEVGVSVYVSEGFTLSEILRRKRLAGKSVSEGVVEAAQIPQCEFSNFQHLPLTFPLDFLCWPVLGDN